MMTRRERHLNIIASWGDSASFRYERDRLVYWRDLAAFTDEAVEELARALIAGKKRQDKWNREASARREAKDIAEATP